MGNHPNQGKAVQEPATEPQAVQLTAEQRIAELERALAEKNAQLDASKAETAKLREERQPGVVSFAIGPKGGVIIRGLNRQGISLYGSQVHRMAEEMPRLVAFTEQHKDNLCWKVNGVTLPPVSPLPNFGKVWDAKAKAYIDGPDTPKAQPTPDVAFAIAAANAERTMAARDERERQQAAQRGEG